MSKKKLKNFTINANITAWVGIQIKAESLEDALAQSKDLKAEDFITIEPNEHLDSSLEIQGVSKNFE